MSETDTLSYTDDYILKIASGPSLLGNKGPLVAPQADTQVSGLERLKKKLIRTELHAKFLTDCLNANIIPVGLQVKNIPVIFTEDDHFKTHFSFASNKCSRTWMVLGIETAIKHIRLLKNEIEELEKKILGDQSINNAKQALDNLEATIKEFEKINISKKTEKLQWDIRKYNKERTYPYLRKDFYTASANHIPPKRVTFSDTGSDTDSDSTPTRDLPPSEYPSTSGQNFLYQGQRGFSQRPRRRGGRRGWFRNQYTPGQRQTRNSHFEW